MECFVPEATVQSPGFPLAGLRLRIGLSRHPDPPSLQARQARRTYPGAAAASHLTHPGAIMADILPRSA
jgi:hypothetical protein